MAKTQNLTVMFTDIVDFAARTSNQSRAQNRTMLQNHNRLLLPLVGRFGGRRVKSIGDALLITFHSPTDAVHCGMALHDALAEFNRERAEEEQIHLRVAINVGEVRIDGNDVFGEAVNVASRVEGLTPPDQIYFTEAVYLAMNKAEVPSAPVGKHKLKGIPEDVNLYQVPVRQVTRLVPGGEDMGAAPGELPFGGMHRKPRPTHGFGALVGKMVQTSGLRGDGTATQGRRPLALIAVAAVVALGAFALLMRPSTVDTSATVVADTDLPPAEAAAATTATPAPVAAPVPEDPEVRREREIREAMVRGAEAFRQNRRREAVPAYAQALKLEPKLQHDPQLAQHLAACLSWASDLAIPLIKRYPSPEILEAVAGRTKADRDLGAQRAAALLTELGKAELIDPGYVAIGDLEKAQTCEAKRDAVLRLRPLRDPRALDALKASVGSGFQAWFKNRCFRSEAEAAIKEIEQAGAVPTPAS